MLKHVLLAFVLSVARGQDNAHVRIDTGGEIHVARGGSFVIGATPEVADPSPPSASPLPPPSPSPAPPPLHTTADLYIPFIASEGGYTDAITNLAPTTTSMSNMPSTGFTYASFNTRLTRTITSPTRQAAPRMSARATLPSHFACARTPTRPPTAATTAEFM